MIPHNIAFSLILLLKLLGMCFWYCVGEDYKGLIMCGYGF